MELRAGGFSQQGAQGQAAPAVPMASMGTNVGGKVPVRFPITPSPCLLPPELQSGDRCRRMQGRGWRGSRLLPALPGWWRTLWVWPELGGKTCCQDRSSSFNFD